MKKTAVITGASRGIGRAIAEAFAKDGYNIAMTCSSSIEELLAFAEELKNKYGTECLAMKASSGKYEEISKFFSNHFFEENGVDVLVNNAGISYVGLLHEMSIEKWQEVMDVNLNGCFFSSKEVIPYMLRKHEGHIINISSMWGNVGASMEVAYSASKGGVNSFTKALSKELAPSGITVNAIACGLIDTSMNSCFSKEELDLFIDEIPACRIGRPEEVAELALNIAEGPAYMTGQIITLDGGYT